MSDQSERTDSEIVHDGDEPQPLPWFTPEPPKPPGRLRKEEAFLWIWRVVLVVGVIPALVLAYMGAGGEVAALSDVHIDDPELLRSLQFGLMFFVGAEMVYYFYLSWAFRRFRDWGLVFWLAGAVALGLGIAYPIG